MNILINIGVFLLILVSVLLVLLVLMQRAKSDGAISAMGGGIAEATFGADTGNVLSKATIYLAIAFFLLSLLTGLATIHQHRHGKQEGGALPSITAPAAPASVPATAPAAPAAPAPAK
ncbi:preprotein translocase subunit SecG [Nibricoccus sp. IMCC34717]|uniref:preprotein translocase subunit SecG n=1 Tax=Nibricoccus sp. IMCC34717 TaxID=3034021 RepID=UPI00384E4357